MPQGQAWHVDAGGVVAGALVVVGTGALVVVVGTGALVVAVVTGALVVVVVTGALVVVGTGASVVAGALVVEATGALVVPVISRVISEMSQGLLQARRRQKCTRLASAPG